MLTLRLRRGHADIGWLLLAVHRGAAPVRAEPFDRVPLDLAGLWAA